jgi:hypothetical protein
MEHNEAQRTNTESVQDKIVACASALGVLPWKLEFVLTQEGLL